jgi:hypothetical protein
LELGAHGHGIPDRCPRAPPCPSSPGSPPGKRPAAGGLLGIFLALVGAAVALAWAIAREPVTHYQGVGIGVALTGAVFLTGAA